MRSNRQVHVQDNRVAISLCSPRNSPAPGAATMRSAQISANSQGARAVRTARATVKGLGTRSPRPAHLFARLTLWYMTKGASSLPPLRMPKIKINIVGALRLDEDGVLVYSLEVGAKSQRRSVWLPVTRPFERDWP